jgi:hypothetical protein
MAAATATAPSAKRPRCVPDCDGTVIGEADIDLSFGAGGSDHFGPLDRLPDVPILDVCAVPEIGHLPDAARVGYLKAALGVHRAAQIELAALAVRRRV